MSHPPLHTGHEKEKTHLSLQVRQDQVHPSEVSSIASVHSRSLNDIAGLANSSHARKSILPNGEATRERIADGVWKYSWPTGIKFEGTLSNKFGPGSGKITWPSGASYEGKLFNWCMNGLGTYIDKDHSIYIGDWVMNMNHGYGEKWYANGDEYKGCWCQGKREGSGSYTWANGNVYTGDWKGGTMCGKGKLTWNNGDSFQGHWSDGKAHGHGIYTWAENGCYVGTWSRGLKDGKGTFYPPGTEPPHHRWLLYGTLIGSNSREGPRSHQHSFRTLSTDVGKLIGLNFAKANYTADPGGSRGSMERFIRKAESLPTKAIALERKWSLDTAIEKFLGYDTSSIPSSIAGEPILEDDEFRLEEAYLPIVEREYAQGVLINEIVKDSPSSKQARRRQKRQAREIKRPGETIIKGHRSYDLMLNLQLGIRYSVGKTLGLQSDLSNSDFGHRARIWIRFPRGGSQMTPPHASVDFWWKDYCPIVFRNLREMFKIDAADYMLSICGNDALRELLSPGKSGSIFFLSHDDRFLIKTLRKQELKVLLKMLPNYYDHVNKYENTLITKFFGLHCIKLAGGHKARFVVMGNVFCSELRIHKRFDLKGSSLGRSTSKIEIDETTTLKDLDLDFTFHLEPSWRSSLLQQIEDDCSFLESQQIMDYSLLLGLHFRAPQCTYLNSKKPAAEGEMSSFIDDDESEAYPESLVLVAHEPNNRRTLGSHIRGSSLRAVSAGDEEVDLLLAGTARVQIQLGVNMPARADRNFSLSETDPAFEGDNFGETYDVVLCLGIIDILQEYNIAKKIEHAYKSLHFDSVSISSVDPQLYSERFQQFLRKAFPGDSY